MLTISRKTKIFGGLIGSFSMSATKLLKCMEFENVMKYVQCKCIVILLDKEGIVEKKIIPINMNI